MSSLRKRKLLRITLIVILTILGLTITIGPVLYVIFKKPVNIQGPTMGPRTY